MNLVEEAYKSVSDLVIYKTMRSTLKDKQLEGQPQVPYAAFQLHVNAMKTTISVFRRLPEGVESADSRDWPVDFVEKGLNVLTMKILPYVQYDKERFSDLAKAYSLLNHKLQKYTEYRAELIEKAEREERERKEEEQAKFDFYKQHTLRLRHHNIQTDEESPDDEDKPQSPRPKYWWQNILKRGG